MRISAALGLFLLTITVCGVVDGRSTTYRRTRSKSILHQTDAGDETTAPSFQTSITTVSSEKEHVHKQDIELQHATTVQPEEDAVSVRYEIYEEAQEPELPSQSKQPAIKGLPVPPAQPVQPIPTEPAQQQTTITSAPAAWTEVSIQHTQPQSSEQAHKHFETTTQPPHNHGRPTHVMKTSTTAAEPCVKSKNTEIVHPEPSRRCSPPSKLHSPGRKQDASSDSQRCDDDKPEIDVRTLATTVKPNVKFVHTHGEYDNDGYGGHGFGHHYHGGYDNYDHNHGGYGGYGSYGGYGGYGSYGSYGDFNAHKNYGGYGSYDAPKNYGGHGFGDGF